MAFNASRAQSRNRRYGRDLGWATHRRRIEGLFYIRPESDAKFAEAVAQWQLTHLPQLLSDGIIGPNTWMWMSRVLGIFNADWAIRQNRHYRQKLGWKRHFARLAEHFGIYSSKEDTLREFSIAIFGWQGSRGLMADGIVGPATWSQLEAEVLQCSENTGATTIQTGPSSTKSLPALPSSKGKWMPSWIKQVLFTEVLTN